MRKLFAAVWILSCFISYSQKTKVPPKKYPSLLWEISGNGMKKPSYLFGTMHVSSKMVFHLSDSFYLGIKNADVVALETDMGNWQDDFSRYEMEYAGYSYNYSYSKNSLNYPDDYFTISTLQFPPYEKMIELALYSSPSVINSFLYRTNSERIADFEEDTYLDMHIYQAGKKWGKKVCGVEDFHQSMQLMKEAYADAVKEKDKKEKSYDYDEDFSYSNMEDAYRTGNLDLLDTINKINSSSAAFDEKFLYKRNEIQANSIDSILKTKQTLFAGVGAAHLPGQRGVIEMLRQKGYRLRAIKMTERDSKHKEEVEKIRVPVKFAKQTSADGFFSVNLPGKLYDFNEASGLVDQKQFADMSNGAYYMVTRIHTNSMLWGHSEDVVLKKIDSVIYENVPGKILTKTAITKNGYKGFDVTNRTRRGDFQRYNIFVTPFEVVLFKMSGNGDYVKEGTEASQFFNSVEFKNYTTNWKKWSPPFGGFEAGFPHEPVMTKKGNWQFMAIDQATNTSYEVLRTDIHNYNFVEEDSFDLALMEESFASSDFIDKQLSRKHAKAGSYPALDVKYQYKDGSVALARFLIKGPHYYTLIAHGKNESPKMNQFISSFSITPFVYDKPKQITDTSLYFTVYSSVPLEKEKKISMYPDNMYQYGYYESNDEAELMETSTFRSRLVESDSTGEKIYVSVIKSGRYFYTPDTASNSDSSLFLTDRMDWQFRSKKKYELPNKTKVFEYVMGDRKSSRYVQGKVFTKDGVMTRLETMGDTLSKPGSFVSNFFETFMPGDTVKGSNPGEKKAKIFFEDFFSKDSLQHKRAVVNVNALEFDSADFPKLKKAIQSLTWKEKKYMDAKNDFVWKVSNIKTKEASDFLREIYYAAGDTIEFQYTVLEALLDQQTAYACNVFKEIMLSEPPVLIVGRRSDNSYNNNYGRRKYRNNPVYPSNISITTTVDYGYGNTYGMPSFLSALSDSLKLTAAIAKDLLPLMNIDDYEQPVMELMGTLTDSNLLSAKDYEMYQSEFLIEAKQLLKKQVISEKNKSIEEAKKDDEDKVDYYNYGTDEDYGNKDLSLYATLLMPFWEKNPAVPQFINQLLKSKDKRLKYNTALLLLRNKKPLPDTMLNYFAAVDEYRYELYSDLKENKLVNLFPVAYNNQVQLAKSKMLKQQSGYNKPDSIVYIDKLPVQYKDRSGYVFFFKYKPKKDDINWKLASVGIIPSDPKQFEFEKENDYFKEMEYDFTEMTGTKIDTEIPIKDQLQKALKKILYSKRNSAAEFYRDENNMDVNYLYNYHRD